MNPQDPLLQLHPLREPALIGWWPLAPGWWLLLIALLLILAGLSYGLLKRYRGNAYRRQGMAQLQQLRARFAQHDNPALYISDLNALLKSVALKAYPRNVIAAASGERWLEFLNNSVSDGERFDVQFINAAYRPQPVAVDLEQTHRAAAHWIRRHGVSA